MDFLVIYRTLELDFEIEAFMVMAWKNKVHIAMNCYKGWKRFLSQTLCKTCIESYCNDFQKIQNLFFNLFLVQLIKQSKVAKRIYN